MTTTQTKKKNKETKILIADDDKNFLLSIVDGLRDFSKSFTVFTAENGKQAVEILAKHNVDLVVTDLKMPVMDGLELLAHMVSYYPQVPVIVITAYATRELEDCVANMGAFKFIEKPLNFHMLLEKINEAIDASSHYFTKVLSILSFLQTLVNEAKTCRVTVCSNQDTGYLYFFQGVLLDGEFDGVRGAEAVYHMVSWKNAEVEIDYNFEGSAKKVGTPLNFILEEEFNRHANVQDDKPVVTDHLEEAGEKGLDREVMKMDSVKMEKAVDILKNDMGEALLNTGVMSGLDGRLVFEDGIHPKTGVFFKQLTAFMKRMLTECNMPPMGKYYLIELEGEKSLIAIPRKHFIWGITLDLDKTPLGLFLNVTMPRILKAFDEAIIEGT